jgi:hypothetical protein
MEIRVAFAISPNGQGGLFPIMPDGIKDGEVRPIIEGKQYRQNHNGSSARQGTP